MELRQILNELPEPLMKMLSTIARYTEPKKILPLAHKNNDSDTTCETYDDRIPNIFDRATQTGNTHDKQDDTRHKSCYLQPFDSVFSRHSSENDNESPGRSSDLHTTATE